MPIGPDCSGPRKPAVPNCKRPEKRLFNSSVLSVSINDCNSWRVSWSGS